MNVFNCINCKLSFTPTGVVVHIVQFMPHKFVASAIFPVKEKFPYFMQFFIYFSGSFYASG